MQNECIKGKRACPPDTFDLEAMGGIHYYGNLRKITGKS
jgi:hypothetical protein